jgi:hypothetical protein
MIGIKIDTDRRRPKMPMADLDMVNVSYFGGFLSVGSRVSFEHNMLFMVCSAKKVCRPAGKACRPGPALN